MLDITTANAIVSVHDALSEENRQKLVKYPILKQVNIVWKCIGNAGKG